MSNKQIKNIEDILEFGMNKSWLEIKKGVSQDPRVFIILVNWNGLSDTIECIDSLNKVTYKNYRVIVVDNASSGDDVVLLREKYGDKIDFIENDENLGFVGGNNVGVEFALREGAELVLFLNNDTIVTPDFLAHLVDAMQRDKSIGICGSKIYFEHDRNLIWFAGGKDIRFNYKYVHFGQDEIDRGQYDVDREVYFITGCVFLVRAEILKRIGSLDEDYFSYVEDNDLCRRSKRLGYKIFYVHKSVVYHKGNKSTRGRGLIHVYYRTRNRLLFIRKNVPVPLRYPFYFYWLTIFFGRSVRFLIQMRYRPVVTMFFGIRDFFLGRYGKQWDTVEHALSFPTKNMIKKRIKNALPVKVAYFIKKTYHVLYPPMRKKKRIEGEQALSSVLSKMKLDSEEGRKKIGVLSFGGIGDLLMINAFGRALRRKYPDAHITLFFDTDTGSEFIDIYGIFNGLIYFGPQRNIPYLVKNLYLHFDIFYDSYRITKTYYGTKLLENEKNKADKLFKEYNLGKFYRYRPARANKLASLKEHFILVMMKSAGLTGSIDDVMITLPGAYKSKKEFSGNKYVVLSHSSNKRITTHKNQMSTKNWDTEKWKKVISYLNKQGITVVQVGEKDNQLVEGAVDYLGKTDILTTASIIRDAFFYMGTEGGIAHLAEAVGTPSLILFGPTSVECFGYPKNINIQNEECINCWWSKPDWFNTCPKGYDPPLCMELITVENVKKGIDRLREKINS